MMKALVTPLGGWSQKINVGWVPINFWKHKIKNDEKFYFIKVNHGIFDIMARIPDLKYKNARQIGRALYPKRHPRNKKVPKKTYIKIMSSLVNHIRNYDRVPKDLYIGLSNTNGIGLFKGRKNDALVQLVNPLTKRIFLYGGLIRRYTVANEIPNFLKEVKKSGYHVHIIGPAHCKEYKKQVPGKCTHHIIPYEGALGKLDELIDRVEKTLTGKDLLLTSLTTGTFLFYQKLKERNLLGGMSLLDLGRALDYTTRDHPMVAAHPWLSKLRTRRIHREYYQHIQDEGYMYGWEDVVIRQTKNF